MHARSFSMRALLAAACLLTAIGSGMAATGRIGDTPAPPGHEGVVFERSKVPGFVDVDQYDGIGQRLGTVKARVPLVFNPKTGYYEATINVGRVVNGYRYRNVIYSKTRPKNITLDGPGLIAQLPVLEDDAVSKLDLESFYLGDDGLVHLEGLFARLQRMIGTAELQIPDAFTLNVAPDSEGLFTLYSLVNILGFVPAQVSFNLGDVFNITDGESTLLPGMQFSTTPFDFDPLLGFVGTPYTGEVTILALHGLSAVPEPATLALLGLAWLGLLGSRRPRGPQATPPARTTSGRRGYGQV